MIRFSITIFIFFLFISGCSTFVSRIDEAKEIQKVRDADRALLHAENKRDLEGAMEYIAEGAVYHPPDSPPIIGHEAIRNYYVEWFKAPYIGIFCESDSIVISSSEDLAYLIGNSYIELDTPEGNIRVNGKYITIWQKSDEKWLCTAVSWSANDSIE
ncbi:YybH family protein [Bacteroidota bacterium]